MRGASEVAVLLSMRFRIPPHRSACGPDRHCSGRITRHSETGPILASRAPSPIPGSLAPTAALNNRNSGSFPETRSQESIVQESHGEPHFNGAMSQCGRSARAARKQAAMATGTGQALAGAPPQWAASCHRHRWSFEPEPNVSRSSDEVAMVRRAAAVVGIDHVAEGTRGTACLHECTQLVPCSAVTASGTRCGHPSGISVRG